MTQQRRVQTVHTGQRQRRGMRWNRAPQTSCKHFYFADATNRHLFALVPHGTNEKITAPRALPHRADRFALESELPSKSASPSVAIPYGDKGNARDPSISSRSRDVRCGISIDVANQSPTETLPAHVHQRSRIPSPLNLKCADRCTHSHLTGSRISSPIHCQPCSQPPPSTLYNVTRLAWRDRLSVASCCCAVNSVR